MILPDLPLPTYEAIHSWAETPESPQDGHRSKAEPRKSPARGLYYRYEVRLACVAHNESRGDPTAVNTSSGAAGKYQLMPAYSDDWAIRYGRPAWAHLTADQWPERVQDHVAAHLWHATDGGAWLDFTSYAC